MTRYDCKSIIITQQLIGKFSTRTYENGGVALKLAGEKTGSTVAIKCWFQEDFPKEIKLDESML